MAPAFEHRIIGAVPAQARTHLFPVRMTRAVAVAADWSKSGAVPRKMTEQFSKPSGQFVNVVPSAMVMALLQDGRGQSDDGDVLQVVGSGSDVHDDAWAVDDRWSSSVRGRRDGGVGGSEGGVQGVRRVICTDRWPNGSVGRHYVLRSGSDLVSVGPLMRSSCHPLPWRGDFAGR